jgi:hypothetical protein
MDIKNIKKGKSEKIDDSVNVSEFQKFKKWKSEKDVEMKKLNSNIIDSEKNLAMHYHDMYMQGRMTKSQYNKAISSVNKHLKNLGSDYRY